MRRIKVVVPSDLILGRLIDYVLEADPAAKVQVTTNESVFLVTYETHDVSRAELSDSAIVKQFGDTSYEEYILFWHAKKDPDILRLWIPADLVISDEYEFAAKIARSVDQDFVGESDGHIAILFKYAKLNKLPLKVNEVGNIL